MAEYKSSYTGAQIDAGIGKANTAVQPAALDNYQAKIDSSHKLSADLISDGSTNKTVTESEKTTWSGKSVVSGTNDGTNWSTITINGTTKNIPSGGGGSSVTVKEINFMDSDEWDIEENQPTQTVIADILANHYTFIHLYEIPVDEDIEADMWLIANMSAEIEGSTGARYYYKFDEGDEEEGTSPNIEQYLFVYEDHEGGTYQMIVDQFDLGTKIDSSNKLSADLVDDTSSTNKFVSASDKTTWNGKSVVSGTNDGSNWTSLTIDGTTKTIPAGGSSLNTRLYTFNQAYDNWCSGQSFPIVFCGDSTIAGYGTTDPSGKTKAWVKRLEEKLRYDCNNQNVTLYNAAATGSTTPSASQFDTWFGSGGTYASCKMVGIGWGINDRLSFDNRKDYYNSIYNKNEALILKAFEYNIQPFMLTTQATSESNNVSASTSNLRTASDIEICANNAKRDLAKKYNLEIIDMNVFTEIYMKNSKVAVDTIIPDRLHFANIGNLFEAGVAFSQMVNRTIIVNGKEQVIVNYSDQHVTHGIPETLISYGGDLKVYVESSGYGANKKIFDTYIFIKDYPATISAIKNDENSDTYILVDHEVSETADSIELEDLKTDLDDLDVGLHHFEVYTGSGAKADFAGFIINEMTTTPQVIPVQSIAFSPNTYSTGTNQPVQTTLTFTPENATNKNVTYTATGGTITSSGQFLATTAGSYTITATSEDGNKQAICTVSVVQPVAVTGVTLDESTATMYKDDTLQLTATVAPSNATNKAVTWSVNNNLCTVSQTGLVTCTSASPGTSVVTVTTSDGGFTATCTITVEETLEPTELANSLSLGKGTAFDNMGSTIVPVALYYNYNSTNHTTDLSGHTITSIETYLSGAGVLSFGVLTVDSSGKNSDNVTWKETVTISSGDIGANNYATITLNNLRIGANETLVIGKTTDTSRPYYVASSNNAMKMTTNNGGTPTGSSIMMPAKIIGF